MNTQRILLTIFIGILVVTTSWTVLAKRTSSSTAGFEYKILEGSDVVISESEMNRLGGQGWELVAATVVTHGNGTPTHKLFFLRNR